MQEIKQEIKLIPVDNIPPVLPIEAFSTIDLFNFMCIGELDWGDIPESIQRSMVYQGLVDNQGNIRPRIHFIPYKSEWV